MSVASDDAPKAPAKSASTAKKRGLGRGLEALLGPKAAAEAPSLEANGNDTLRNLPVDVLKIDGQFVRDIDRDPVSLAMVKSIHEIGCLMGKRTVAEFVESQALLALLRDIGVHYAQGYAVGRPVPLAQVLQGHRSTPS